MPPIDDDDKDISADSAEDAAIVLDDVIASAITGEEPTEDKTSDDDGEEQENQDPDLETNQSGDDQTDEEDDAFEGDSDKEGTVVVPSEWTDEEVALFEDLEPNVQELVLGAGKRFQADYTRKTQDLSKEAATQAGMTEVIERNRDIIELAGSNPAQAVATLFAAQRILQMDGVKGIQYLMKSYDVGLADLGGEGQGNNDIGEEIVLPGMKALSDRLERIEKAGTDSAAAAHDRGQQEAADTITAFETEKDSKTKELLHPHFTDEKVRRMVGSLIGDKHANNLDEAYTMTVRSLGLESVKPKPKPASNRGSRRAKISRAKVAGRNPFQRSDGKSGKSADIDSAITAAMQSSGVTGA
jgi:hypothetical protein